MIAALYGPGAYFEMIGSLFGMTGGASDYTAGGMIALIIDAYLSTASGMIIMIPCLAAGVIMFMILPEKYVMVKKILYVIGLLVLVRYYFSRGIFTRNYQYYDSVFKAAMMFVIITLILAVIGSAGILNGSRQEQTLAFAILMVILITPVGSNNYTYPVINNLFLAAPVSLWLLRRFMQRMGDGQINYPWQAMITMVIAVTLIQGTVFHSCFAFGDGTSGERRDTRCTISKVSGMKTNAYNAEALDALYEALDSNNLLEDKVILFGAVPGLAYIFDLEPAIDTVWPDLDSYATHKFEDQLLVLGTSDDSTPTVIIGNEIPEYANSEEKYDILLDYISVHDYNKVFESDRFTVFAGGNESED